MKSYLKKENKKTLYEKLFIAVLIIVSLTFVYSCTDFFQRKIPMNNGFNNILSDAIRVDSELKQLPTPSEIFISREDSATDITVTWKAVPNASSYCIERAICDPTSPDFQDPPDDSLFSVIKRYVYGTSYTDVILDSPDYTNVSYLNGYRYYYRIYAENKREKYDSSDPTSNKNYGTLFAPVTNVSAGAGRSQEEIEVTWRKTKNALGYDIYRTKNENGTGAERVGSVRGNTTSYKNKVLESERGVEFYFTVIAKNSNGRSVPSAMALGYALKAGAPTSPSNVKIVSSKGRGDTKDKISVQWNAAVGNPSGIDMHYSVYRSSSKDSSKTLVKNDMTGTTIDDGKNLETGVLYYYFIKPFYTDANGELFNGPMSEDNCEGFLLSPPSSLSAIKNPDGSQTLSFTPAIGSGEVTSFDSSKIEYTYSILCSPDNIAYSPLGISPNPIAGPYTLNSNGMIEVSIPAVNIGTSKFYKVTTINSNSVESVSSIAVAPSPYGATDCVASKAKYIAPKYDPNASGVYPVEITWKKPVNDDPAGYYVYRSAKHDTGFKLISADPVVGTSFVDENSTAKPEAVYYYKVLALNTLNQGINYTNTAYGYGALSAEQYLVQFIPTMKNSQSKLKLMHSYGQDALGQETINGDLGGTLFYHAYLQGLSAAIVILKYTNYSDYQIKFINPDTMKEEKLTTYFLNGNTDSSMNLSLNGKMNGTVTMSNCMYPGKIFFDRLVLTGGKIRDGVYEIQQDSFPGKTEVTYKLGTW
ncbi:MAG: fibronectin type III domain-containing protein [Treponemataceae bacterium]